MTCAPSANVTSHGDTAPYYASHGCLLPSTTTTTTTSLHHHMGPPATVPEEHACPKRIVQRFIALRQAVLIDAAVALLDPAVQLSYPGLPYGKSVADWKRYAGTVHARIDVEYSWQVVQQGAHAAQVMRRGCVRGRPGQAVLEVFELHESNPGNWVIGAMYLRRAPRQWTLWWGGGGNRTTGGLRQSKQHHQQSATRWSLPSQRYERDMLQGDASEDDGCHLGNNKDLYDSSDDYYLCHGDE